MDQTIQLLVCTGTLKEDVKLEFSIEGLLNSKKIVCSEDFVRKL